MITRSGALGLLVLLAGVTAGEARQAPAAESRDPRVALLQRYVRADTTNPPGNEGRGIAVLTPPLHAAGIATKIVVSPTGRPSLWARLPATTSEAAAPALLLLHHVDVVPAEGRWRRPPFDAVLADGRLWGRGAIDAKSLGVAHLEAMLQASQLGHRVRDLVLLAAADEEAGGGEGVSWLLEAHPELFEGVGAVLNEGGLNRAVKGRLLWWGIEVAQKRPLWLRASIGGRGGHASSANPYSATHLLIRGLARAVDLEHPWRLTRASYDYLSSLCDFHGRAFVAIFCAPTFTAAERRFEKALAEGTLGRALMPGMQNLFVDSLQVTTFDNGNDSINVVPPAASATLDLRLLPDTDADEVLRRLQETLTSDIDVEVLLEAPPVPDSDLDHPLYRLLQTELGDASTPVVPAFIAGTTDSRLLRARGVPAFGFSPFVLESADAAGIHGVDESIPLDRFLEGVDRMARIVALHLERPPATPQPAESAP